MISLTNPIVVVKGLAVTAQSTGSFPAPDSKVHARRMDAAPALAGAPESLALCSCLHAGDRKLAG